MGKGVFWGGKWKGRGLTIATNSGWKSTTFAQENIVYRNPSPNYFVEILAPDSIAFGNRHLSVFHPPHPETSAALSPFAPVMPAAVDKRSLLDAWSRPQFHTANDMIPLGIIKRPPGSHLLPLAQRPF